MKNVVYIFLFFFQDKPVLLSCWCWLVSWRIFMLPCWHLSWMWLAWDTIRALCVMPCPGQMGWISFIVIHGANTSSHCWDKTWRMLDRTPQRSVQICMAICMASIHPFIPLLVHPFNLFHPAILLSIHPSIHRFHCPSIHLFLCTSIPFSVYPSIPLSMHTAII